MRVLMFGGSGYTGRRLSSFLVCEGCQKLVMQTYLGLSVMWLVAMIKSFLLRGQAPKPAPYAGLP